MSKWDAMRDDEIDALRTEIETLRARVAELEREQAAWRKFTEEANKTVDKAEARAEFAEKAVADARTENARLVAANKARDEFLRGHRYKRSEMDGYIDLCESQMADLKARLADVERQLTDTAVIAQERYTIHCNWHQDGEDCDTWQTDCGHYFCINEGTPVENEFKYCAFCGKPLAQYPYTEEET
jgi:chromosome segregation ATPase